MAQRITDTTPTAEAVLNDLLRKMSPWRKWERVHRLNVMLRTLALSDIRRLYPQAGEAELRRRLADRLLGTELAYKVYGPLPPPGVDDE